VAPPTGGAGYQYGLNSVSNFTDEGDHAGLGLTWESDRCADVRATQNACVDPEVAALTGDQCSVTMEFEPFTVYYLDEDSMAGISPAEHEAQARTRFLSGEEHGYEEAVADILAAEAIAEQVGRLTSLKAESWIETNAQLMNALTAQSLSTNMIIIFVAISVAFGIASVLSVSVVQRTREIGILRATGATRRQIMRVFLIQGGLFGLLGSVMGIAVSYLLVWVFNTFGPGLFIITVSTTLVAAALLLATLTGVLAAAVPSRRAARLDPVVAIRYV